MKHLLALLLLLLLGCSKVDVARIEMARMRKKVDENVVRMVSRYQQASISEVEAALNDYLVLANDYERRGWSQYGSTGWIDDLRGLCEVRLALFKEAVGDTESYRFHMDRALAHMKKANPQVDYTEEGLRDGIERLDAVNIQPNWRKQLAQQIDAGKQNKPLRANTNQTSSSTL
jgi:hypothetical protein